MTVEKEGYTHTFARKFLIIDISVNLRYVVGNLRNKNLPSLDLSKLDTVGNRTYIPHLNTLLYSRYTTHEIINIKYW